MRAFSKARQQLPSSQEAFACIETTLLFCPVKRLLALLRRRRESLYGTGYFKSGFRDKTEPSEKADVISFAKAWFCGLLGLISLSIESTFSFCIFNLGVGDIVDAHQLPEVFL
ncbi:MAG: hypothetical protein ACLUKN_13240 [Bacilli bacterium]